MTLCNLLAMLGPLTGLPKNDGEVRIEVQLKWNEEDGTRWNSAVLDSIQILEDGTIILQGESE